MSRHSDVPPFARRYAPNHPAVRSKILAEVDSDLRRPEREYLYFDTDGQLRRHEPEPEDVRDVDWGLVFVLLCLFGIVLMLGIGGGLWLTK